MKKKTKIIVSVSVIAAVFAIGLTTFFVSGSKRDHGSGGDDIDKYETIATYDRAERVFNIATDDNAEAETVNVEGYVNDKGEIIIDQDKTEVTEVIEEGGEKFAVVKDADNKETKVKVEETESGELKVALDKKTTVMDVTNIAETDTKTGKKTVDQEKVTEIKREVKESAGDSSTSLKTDNKTSEGTSLPIIYTATATPTPVEVKTVTVTPKPTKQNTETPKTTETVKEPTESVKNTDTPTPTEKPVNTQAPKATDTPKATNTPRSTPKPTEAAKTTNTPKPTEAPKATEAPKPVATDTPKPDPTSTPKPTDTPKPDPTNTPTTAPTKPAHVHTWEAQYKTVHHDAVTHQEPVYGDYEWPVEAQVHRCKVCHKSSYDIGADKFEIRDAGGYGEAVLVYSDNDLWNRHTEHCAYLVDFANGGYYSDMQVVGTYVYHNAILEYKTVVDQEAYDEKVYIGEKCTGCGETR